MWSHREFRFDQFRRQMFERGDLKYVILEQLKDKPAHGYELIKALEERFGGFYAPSPGAVYPTLQMLEDMGYVSAQQQEGRKVYTITDAGRSFMKERQPQVDEVFSRMKERWGAEWGPQAQRLMHELRNDLRDLGRSVASEARHRWPDPEQQRRIRDVVGRAKPEHRHLRGFGVQHPVDSGRHQLLAGERQQGHLPEEVGRLLRVVGVGAGEIDQPVDRLLGHRAPTRAKARHQEGGEVLAWQRAEWIGARHLQERSTPLVHRLAQQRLAGPEQRVTDMLLVLNHRPELAEQRRAQFHQVLELIEDHDHPLSFAGSRDHLGFLEELLEQGVEVGGPGAARFEGELRMAVVIDGQGGPDAKGLEMLHHPVLGALGGTAKRFEVG